MNPSFRSGRPEDRLVMTGKDQSIVENDVIATSHGERLSPGEIDRLASEQVEQMEIDSLVDETRAYQAWSAFYAARSARTAYAFDAAIGHLLKAVAMIDDTALAERLLGKQLEVVTGKFREEYQKRVVSCFQPAAETASQPAVTGHEQRTVTPSQGPVLTAEGRDRRTRSYGVLRRQSYRVVALAIACIIVTMGLKFLRPLASPSVGPDNLTSRPLKDSPPPSSYERKARNEKFDSPVIVNLPHQDDRTLPPPIEIEHKPKREEVPNYASQLRELMENESEVLPKAVETPGPATQLTLEGFKRFGREAFPLKPPVQPERKDEVVRIINSSLKTSRNEEADSMTEKQYEDQLQAAEAASGPASAKTAKCLAELADFYIKQRKFYTAAPLSERRLAILQSVLSTDGTEFRKCTLQLASIYLATQQTERASELLETSLPAFEEELGPDHADTVSCREHLGIACLQQADFVKAYAHFRKVLKAQEATTETNEPAIADSCDNIGFASLSMGNFLESHRYYQRAYEIRHKELGPDDPALARSFNSMGLFSIATQRYDDASKYFNYSRTMIARALGETDILTAAACDNLAKVEFIRGNYQESVELLLKAQSIYKTVYGPKHGETVAVERLLEEATTRAAQVELEKTTGN
jgi:tetratricopeptide (TPR) repeat protein